MDRTELKFGTSMARGRSRYELIDKDGNTHGPFATLKETWSYASARWPSQEQDEDRTGKGWDVQVEGCDQ